MPHIVLEYSANLPRRQNLQQHFSDIHNILETVAGIRRENCKSRARIAEDYFIGDGDSGNGFVHTHISFVKGRSHQVKQKIGSQVLVLLQELFVDVLSDQLQITVQIEDINLDYYSKYPAGTLTQQN